MCDTTEEDTKRRKSRLAVFEHVSHNKKSDLSQSFGKRNRSKSRSPSECDLVVDDDYDDDNIPPTRKKHRQQIKLTDELLNLECGWFGCTENIVYTDYHKYNEHLYDHCLSINLKENESITCLWDRCTFQAMSLLALVKHICFHGYHTKLKNIGENAIIRNKLPDCSEICTFEIPQVISDYNCEWSDCDVNFTTLYDFYMHMKMHINGNPKTCKKGQYMYCHWKGCSSKCQTQFKLADHVRVHTKEKYVACPSCGALFSTITKFSDHRRRQIPSDMQTYQCSQCSKLFPTERLLREHMRSHINHYKCTMCDMTCPKPSTLAKHIRFRHLNERMYKCNLCDHSCVTKANLDQHLTTHCAEKLMACDECNFRCRSLYGLERHYQVIHGSGKVYNYECHCCKKRFARGNHLTGHLLRKHDFRWPSGHSRFRYKEDSDGIFRLQTVRYESLEVTQEMMKKNSASSADDVTQSVRYNLETKAAGPNNTPSFVLMASECVDEDREEEEEEVDSPSELKEKSIMITIDDVDEKGNLVNSKTLQAMEIVDVKEVHMFDMQAEELLIN